MIFLTRRATFSASHYYWNDSWTAEKNEQVFGRCANRNGHGHNYTLEVTVAGEPDPVTGFVVDLKWLKDVMEQQVLSAYDHRHLNLEVAEFAGSKLIPTTENIAISHGNASSQPSPRLAEQSSPACASMKRRRFLRSIRGQA